MQKPGVTAYVSTKNTGLTSPLPPKPNNFCSGYQRAGRKGKLHSRMCYSLLVRFEEMVVGIESLAFVL